MTKSVNIWYLVPGSVRTEEPEGYGKFGRDEAVRWADGVLEQINNETPWTIVEGMRTCMAEGDRLLSIAPKAVRVEDAFTGEAKSERADWADWKAKASGQAGPEAHAGCPFCAASEHAIASDEHAFGIPDAYPVSPGHALVVTRRHAATLFDLTPEEIASVFRVVEMVKRKTDADRAPDGYNVGTNAGRAAGQTVPHFHLHVIPRYAGDQEDPRFGVRRVIPEKANYTD